MELYPDDPMLCNYFNKFRFGLIACAVGDNVDKLEGSLMYFDGVSN